MTASGALPAPSPRGGPSPVCDRRAVRAVGCGRPDLRGRLGAPARPRLRQHVPGRLGDPDRLLRRAWRSAACSAAASRTVSGRRSGSTACSSSCSSSWSCYAHHVHARARGLSRVLRGAADRPEALALVRFGLSLLALGPATILMGATLPALTRELTRPPAHLSRAFGWLYAANTVGAILGTLAAGLVLIELFGLSGALLVGAACSGLGGRARACCSPAGVARPTGRRPRRRGSLVRRLVAAAPLRRRSPVGPARPHGRLRRRASSRSATRCSGRACSRRARATRPMSSR